MSAVESAKLTSAANAEAIAAWDDDGPCTAIGHARTMSAAGAAVVVNYSSSKKDAEHVVSEIKASGGKAIAVKGDVAKEADMRQLFAEAEAAFGGTGTAVAISPLRFVRFRAPKLERTSECFTLSLPHIRVDRALEFLREDDEETYAAIVPHMESWHDITLVHRGERIVIDGIGFAAIGRLKLLQLLQARARSAGIRSTGAVRRAQRTMAAPSGAPRRGGSDNSPQSIRRDGAAVLRRAGHP